MFSSAMTTGLAARGCRRYSCFVVVAVAVACMFCVSHHNVNNDDSIGRRRRRGGGGSFVVVEAFTTPAQRQQQRGTTSRTTTTAPSSCQQKRTNPRFLQENIRWKSRWLRQSLRIEEDARSVNGKDQNGADADASSVLPQFEAVGAGEQQQLATSSSSSSSSRWDSFDYLRHWYPVSWLRDLPRNGPGKVTLFDVDYAVAVHKDGETVTALVDVCPHRAAALSEGRLTDAGYLQCAYHGWSFDKQGRCVEVPQAAAGAGGRGGGEATATPTATTTKAKFVPRACAKWVPATIHQGMVWLWPGPVPDDADASKLPTPPTVPEMDMPGFKVASTIVRDFPCIDWTLLVSNILDPDHGMFAHQVKGFDLYSATSEQPLKVTESFENNGWTLETTVPAVEKLSKDQKKKERDRVPEPEKTNSKEPLLATNVFQAPSVIQTCRRNAENGETAFVACFWVCPTGTGRSRFMSATVGKLPFGIPRWMSHIGLNNFLDQDSVLVASQQPATLTAEADAVVSAMQKQEQHLQQQQQDQGKDTDTAESETTAAAAAAASTTTAATSKIRHNARQSLYRYKSATDRSVRLIDQFWDTTLSRVPNRVETLLQLRRVGLLQNTPPRETVLDRRAQHLAICPDSQAAVRNAVRVRNGSIVATAAWLALRLIAVARPANKLRMLFKAWVWPVLAALTGWVAEQVRRQFFYKYTEKDRDKDLGTIPNKIWRDPVPKVD